MKILKAVMSVHTGVLAAVLWTLPAAPPAFAEAHPEMAGCASEANNARRLKCYDALSQKLGIAPDDSTTMVSRWKVQKQASAIDDSTNVFLSLDADSSISGWPLKTYTPLMILRCKENKTQAYIVTGMAPQAEYGTDSATVTVRLDADKAMQLRTSRSTSGDMLFFDASGPSIELIKKMMQRSTLFFQFVPFHSSPVMTTFDLRGLSEAIKPLRENCRW
ncbi:MAG: type VI secretion system-associated protein TagO [Ramlibacter sp.]